MFRPIESRTVCTFGSLSMTAARRRRRRLKCVRCAWDCCKTRLCTAWRRPGKSPERSGKHPTTLRLSSSAKASMALVLVLVLVLALALALGLDLELHLQLVAVLLLVL